MTSNPNDEAMKAAMKRVVNERDDEVVATVRILLAFATDSSIEGDLLCRMAFGAAQLELAGLPNQQIVTAIETLNGMAAAAHLAG